MHYFLSVSILMVCAMPGLADEPASAQVVTDPRTVTVTVGGDVLMRYRYADVPYKPCVDVLTTPSGINILRDAPHDHLHHHALMYAIKVNGVNFWEETGEPGVQQHLSIPASQALEGRHTLEQFGIGASGREAGGVFSEQLLWKDHTGAALLNEVRTVAVVQSEQYGCTVLTWFATLKPAGDAPVELSGAHYHGLGMRFLESMDESGTFRYAGAAPGEIVRGDERLTQAPWCAYTAKADGKPVTVAMFDSREPRPAHWFTMQTPFAYLSATLNLYREPLTITQDAPLEIGYGVAVWDGETDDDIIGNTRAAWSHMLPNTREKHVAICAKLMGGNGNGQQ